MSGALRGLVLGSIAIAYLYLFAHAREPLRLNIGEPSADASAALAIDGPHVDAAELDSADGPPLSRLVWRGVAKVVGDDVGRLRPFALVFSLLASWLVFAFASRLYGARVGLIATMLFSTSQLWLAHADSIHQAPLVQCTGFLAMWGGARAIETKLLRHYLAVGLGSFACLLTAYDYYLVVPVAVIASVYLKTGHAFPRGQRRLVAICVAGCAAAIIATCLVGHPPRLGYGYAGGLMSMLPGLARQATLALTPFVWIALAFHLIIAVRATTLAEAIRDNAAWMFVVAVVSLQWISPGALSRPIALQAFLPFYAIGSALVISQLLGGSAGNRRLAVAWLVAAPLWSFYWMFTQQRAALDHDDVAEAKRFLASNDTNDFVLSNLADRAPLEASLRRHSLDAARINGPTEMMQLFELTGAASIDAVIFTDPDSRLTESALSAIVAPRLLWSVLAWPQVVRHKSTAVISDYDRKVFAGLTAAGATKALQLRRFAIYRIDRSATQAILERSVPIASHIDFDTVDAWRHEGLGWGPPRWSDELPAGTVLSGFWRCTDKPCKTVDVDTGLDVPAARWAQIGQLMLRLPQVCDVRVTATFGGPTAVRFTAGTFSTEQLIGSPATAMIPARAFTRGVDIIEVESLWPTPIGIGPRLSTIDLTPECAAP
jgi:hypothetical protein